MALLTSPAAAVGLASFAGDTLLEVWYPAPALTAEPAPVDGLGERAVLGSLYKCENVAADSAAKAVKETF